MSRTRIKALLVAGFILLTLQAKATTTNFWYPYTYTNSIAGNIYFDSYPSGKTFLSVFGMGACAQMAVNWPIVDFTGFPVNSPAQNQQRAHDGSYGAMGFQVGSTGMGYWINTDSATAFNPYMGARDYRIWTQTDNLRPWNITFGSNPVLQTEAKWYNHEWSITGDTSGAALFGQMGICIVDVVHQKSVFYCIGLWDSRGSSQYREYVHMDTGGTHNAIVNTVLAGGTQFCTREATSEATGSLGGYFCARISASQLVAAMTACNNQLGAGLSTNPSDYRLIHLWCGSEGYRPSSSTRITAGYRTYALRAYTVY
ncbi:MAG: hypothetical protein JWQ71_4120 [Pedosphaera sp.]|nr:hypothetical protein [Pedosphaera sp.]